MKGGRSIVNVEQDGMIFATCLADELLHGLDLNGDALVIKESWIEVREVGAVPFFDIRGEF